MIRLTLAEVAAACGGRLEAGDPQATVTRVATDSRTLQRGDLFVALRGERFDGDELRRPGGVGRRGLRRGVAPRRPRACPPPPRASWSTTASAALGRLAAAVRRRARRRVVGITGSAGKTSTKDILGVAAAARGEGGGHARQSEQRDRRAAHAVAGRAEDTDVVVVEMAMRGLGQIRELARIARPDVGVITNIAPVHLELVGTLEDVAAAKAELIEELDGGVAVVPADEPLLDRHVHRYGGRVVTFGGESADVAADGSDARAASSRTRWSTPSATAPRLDFNFSGAHYLRDALAALAAFIVLGYRLDEARHGAAQVAFSDLRGAVTELPGGGLLLNDAYNANPLAMNAAVDHLVAIAAGRPTLAVSATCTSWAPAPRPSTATWASTAPRKACAWWPWASWPAPTSRAPPASAGSPPSRTAWRRCRSSSSPARPCSSKRRAACAWSAWPPPWKPCCRSARMLRAMGASVVAMVLMLLIGPMFIRWLRLNEFGQNIRADGPAGHKTKEGTPTMGGVLIWFAVLVPYVIFSRFSVASSRWCWRPSATPSSASSTTGSRSCASALWVWPRATSCCCSSASSLFIGFIALHFVGLDTRVDLPFTSLKLQLGGFGFYALIFLVLAGFSNAVNLTDGLDGLAAGASAIVLVALAGIAFLIGRNTNDPGISDLMVVAGCVGGACLGFLWFNTFPADVFMGDTGSLGLGGAIAGMAVLTRTELTLLIVGGLFVLEALSVIAQVVSFKLFHRRVLLMAPLHHHFELKAWSETKIIVRFWIVAAMFAGAGFAVYYATFRG